MVGEIEYRIQNTEDRIFNHESRKNGKGEGKEREREEEVSGFLLVVSFSGILPSVFSPHAAPWHLLDAGGCPCDF